MKRTATASKRPGFRRALVVGAALVGIASTMCLPGPGPVARAQSDARTVKLVVPFPAGAGTVDVIARIMAERLARVWTHPVIVENVPGSTGLIGAEAVFKAAPDGNTLLVTAPGVLTVAAHLHALAFDPRQFVPVSLLAIVPTVLVVRRDLPVGNLRDLIDYAQRRPAPLRAANQGAGSTAHLTAEWLRLAAKLNIVHVPFRGSVVALQGQADGRVDLMLDNFGSSLAPIASGQVKLLAVGSALWESSMPDVPTMAESLPGFVSSSWVAIVAPAKTPRDIVVRLSADFVESLHEPDIATRFRQNGCEPAGMAPEATAKFVQAEAEKWTKVVNSKGFRFD